MKPFLLKKGQHVTSYVPKNIYYLDGFLKSNCNMKALFESILNNNIILFETKVNAKRHFTNEEAKEIVDIVKQSIDDGTFDIVDRKKNRDYLKAEKLTKKTAAQIVKMFLQSKSLRAVLVDRNGISNELFVFSIAVPFKGKTKYIYL